MSYITLGILCGGGARLSPCTILFSANSPAASALALPCQKYERWFAQVAPSGGGQAEGSTDKGFSKFRKLRGLGSSAEFGTQNTVNLITGSQ